jgi:DNA topoisomerase-2
MLFICFPNSILQCNSLTIVFQKAKPKTAAKKAPAKKATKAAPKKMVQTTLKPTKPKTTKKTKRGSDHDSEDPASDIDMQDASILSNTPPHAKKQKINDSGKSSGHPLQDIANDSMNVDSASDPKPVPQRKDATDQYQKLTQLQHIIIRPDTYIGSVEKTQEMMWVFNSEISQMELRKVTFVPGLYKIFDEILVNAADNKQRDPSMKQIKVVVNRESGEISIENDGAGIPIEIHKVSILAGSGAIKHLTFNTERENIHP